MDDFNNKYNQKKNPFTVPERYFEELTDRVMEGLTEEKKPRKVKWMQFIRPYVGLAAIFVLALIVVQLIFPLVVNKNQLLVKGPASIASAQENKEEDIFDSQFNPSCEEIIEYLVVEVDEYELLYADLY